MASAPQPSHQARPAGSFRLWPLLAVLMACSSQAATAVRSDEDAAAKVGEAIYLRGILSSGEPLVATHRSGARMTGAEVACVNCHRRSGLGSHEGRYDIPPISARYLYHQRPTDLVHFDLPYVAQMRFNREPYTEATVARAIRGGIDSSDRPLNDLMPHFDLGDRDMAGLLAYLKQLDRRTLPGVTDELLHFATIITPDADPVKRDGMLAVLNQYFADKNAASLSPTPRLRSKHAWKFMVNRRWQLHIWELKGPPDTWGKQLDADFAREPVLAVISGIGGSDWRPVHRFCERNAVPCLFPNVEVPDVSDPDSYSLYFSRGVLLEAQLISDSILDPASSGKLRVVHQVYRTGDSGEAAAQALALSLKERGIKVVNHALAPGKSVASAIDPLRRGGKSDALVLWLRPPDLGHLSEPPHVAGIYMSGLMGGLEFAPLPATWRPLTQVAYPFDLPGERRIRVNFALGWFTVRHIPIVDEQVQADTYLACGLLAETLSHLVDAFIPEYLIERMQDMIEHRIITGYYPRLTLATGQRFASKGGYIVRFSDPQGTRLAAASGWIAP